MVQERNPGRIDSKCDRCMGTLRYTSAFKPYLFCRNACSRYQLDRTCSGRTDWLYHGTSGSTYSGQEGIGGVSSDCGFRKYRHCQSREKSGKYPSVPHRDCIGNPSCRRQPEELYPYGRIICVQHYFVPELQPGHRLYEPCAETAAAVGP